MFVRAWVGQGMRDSQTYFMSPPRVYHPQICSRSMPLRAFGGLPRLHLAVALALAAARLAAAEDYCSYGRCTLSCPLCGIFDCYRCDSDEKCTAGNQCSGEGYESWYFQGPYTYECGANSEVLYFTNWDMDYFQGRPTTVCGVDYYASCTCQCPAGEAARRVGEPVCTHCLHCCATLLAVPTRPGIRPQRASGASSALATSGQAGRMCARRGSAAERTSTAVGRREERNARAVQRSSVQRRSAVVAVACAQRVKGIQLDVAHRSTQAFTHLMHALSDPSQIGAPLSARDASGKCVPKCNGLTDSQTCSGTYVPPGWDRGFTCCGEKLCSFGKCCGTKLCCLDEEMCCGGGSHCCEPGTACCGGGCCESGWNCCKGGTCCPPGTACCGDTCCEANEKCFINRACTGGQCFDNGECALPSRPPPRLPPARPPPCIRALDADCDGVPDSRDNCPTVSNPKQVGEAGRRWAAKRSVVCVAFCHGCHITGCPAFDHWIWRRPTKTATAWATPAAATAQPEP